MLSSCFSIVGREGSGVLALVPRSVYSSYNDFASQRRASLSTLPRRGSSVKMKSTEKNSDSSLAIATSSIDQAKLLISKAISIGAPAYNSGDIQECARVYRETAKQIVPLFPGSNGVRDPLEETIRTSFSDDKSEAWAFRRRFDDIIKYKGEATKAKSKKSTKKDSRDVAADAAVSMDQAKSLIAKAISLGAPAYNSGNIQECARIYRKTAQQIAPLLSSSGGGLREALEKVIQTSYGDEDANPEAWAFRGQFDAIAEYQVPFMPVSAAAYESTNTLEVFSLKHQLPERPLIVNDNVMGGVSQGQWLSQTNTFFGSTSLQNNGGFASLRWRFETFQNWSHAKGIFLKVRHSKPQEHTFRIILKDSMCEQVRLSNYKNDFSNPNPFDENGVDNDDLRPILIPFKAFNQMEQMGRQLPGSPILNPSVITEIGLMAIKPTVVGDFELGIIEWGLYY